MLGGTAQSAIRQSAEAIQMKIAAMATERDRIQKEMSRLQIAYDTLRELLEEDEQEIERTGDSSHRSSAAEDRGPLEGKRALEAALFVMEALGRPMPLDEITRQARSLGYRPNDDELKVKNAIGTALGRALSEMAEIERVKDGVYRFHPQLSTGPT